MNPFENYLGEEDKLQRAVVNYVKMQYKVQAIPCNTESKKSKFEQFKFKAMGGRKGVPDLFIPFPIGIYSGLFIELKKKGFKLRKLNGEHFEGKKGEHLKRQEQYIYELRGLGYCARFSVGFDETKELIDMYFDKKLIL